MIIYCSKNSKAGILAPLSNNLHLKILAHAKQLQFNRAAGYGFKGNAN